MTLLLGGARSGKSRAAERLAAGSGLPVVFVATAEAGDEEMTERIARHQSDRSHDWTTIEAPRDVIASLDSLEPARFVILDCLTLWLSNVLDDDEEAILGTATYMASLLATRFNASAVVSNEVGSAIVPADPLTRRYRDLLGQVNSEFRKAAESAFLCVAGGVVPVQELSS